MLNAPLFVLGQEVRIMQTDEMVRRKLAGKKITITRILPSFDKRHQLIGGRQKVSESPLEFGADFIEVPDHSVSLA